MQVEEWLSNTLLPYIASCDKRKAVLRSCGEIDDIDSHTGHLDVQCSSSGAYCWRFSWVFYPLTAVMDTRMWG